MLTRYRIARHERGFLFVEGDFRRLLEPGVHRVWTLQPHTLHRVTELAPRLRFPEAEVRVS